MTKLFQRRHRQNAARQMKAEHDALLAKAVGALRAAPAEVRNALLSIGGRQRSLRTPTGADLNFREDLARYFAHRVECK